MAALALVIERISDSSVPLTSIAPGSTWGRQSNTIAAAAASGSNSVRRGAIRVGVSLTRGMRRRANARLDGR